MAAEGAKADADTTMLNRLRPDTAGHNLVVKVPIPKHPPPPRPSRTPSYPCLSPSGIPRTQRRDCIARQSSIVPEAYGRGAGAASNAVQTCACVQSRSWRTSQCRRGRAAAGRALRRRASRSASSATSPARCTSQPATSRVRPSSSPPARHATSASQPDVGAMGVVSGDDSKITVSTSVPSLCFAVCSCTQLHGVRLAERQHTMCVCEPVSRG